MNSLRFLILFFLAHHAWSQPFEPYFKELSEQLHLAPPKLPKGSYQVRLWVNVSLFYGQAQDVYIITQKRKKLSLEKRTLWHTKDGLVRSIVGLKAEVKDQTFFNELIANAVLTSRDQSIIIDSLHNVHRSFQQTTRVEIQQDGEVKVIANKPPKLTIVLDGTTYYFEVIGKDFFKKYKFHSPKGYARTYPELEELSRNVDLVRRIFTAFLEKQRVIS